MKCRTGLAVFSLLLVTACATAQPPQPDPLREEVTTLQKQLLELQKLQNETKAKLDESNATIDALSIKIQTLEQRQGAKQTTLVQAGSKSSKAATKKKPAKKTRKKVRRQE
jgi:TolA-binding protein